MHLNPKSENGSYRTPDSCSPPTDEQFRDVWDPAGRYRAVVDPDGTRNTFTFDAPSKTVIEFATGARVTLSWCPSQRTIAPAALSQFAAHVEYRSSSTSAPIQTKADAFLTHPESQRQLTRQANQSLRNSAMPERLADDVVQHADLQLLGDLRRGKLRFEGHDPEQFARWFRGASRNAVAEAIKVCLREIARPRGSSTITDMADSGAPEPPEVAILRELARLVIDEIERIRNSELREVMRDLRDRRSVRESAERLRISKTRIGRMRTRGCRLIAKKVGK